jgi:hypothetical protein
MNNHFELILPIVIAVIYLINAVVNKEKAPPTRGLAPTSRTGGSLPPAPRPPAREPALRVPQPTVQRPSSQRRPGQPEEIVVISDLSRGGRPQPARPAPSSPQRRAGRTRGGPSASSPRPPDAAPEKAVRGWVSQTVSQTIDRPLDLRPLTETQSIGGTALSAQTTSVSFTSAPEISSTADFRRMIADPASIRDALILSELLQPPLVLRNRRSHRA